MVLHCVNALIVFSGHVDFTKLSSCSLVICEAAICNYKMWRCKLCEFSTAVKVRLMSHYRLLHGQYSTTCPLPCPYHNCMCHFKTYNSLKVHMSRVHDASAKSVREVGDRVFKCPLCDFRQPFVERDMFLHLGRHLQQKQMVQCPFKDCSFTSNVYPTFRSHKSRVHSHSSDYATEFVQPIASDQ